MKIRRTMDEWNRNVQNYPEPHAMVGRFSLSQIGCFILRTDFSIRMLHFAKKNIDASFCLSEAGNLPFRDASFDRVLFYSLLHYLPDEEHMRKCVKELIRVCRSGGYILVGDIPSIKHKRKRSTLIGETLKRFSGFLKGIRGSHELAIHRINSWLWCDLDRLADYIESLGHDPKIQEQPEGLPCYNYRFDILIKKM